ncbi:MAG: lipoate--protein ligase family protein [Herpetosiphonaceae bacterium]|nr:lipoate--protein ligase family protein [Herpetosiphonaceae bacterium]
MDVRLIISPPLDGPTNMALDHALARSVGAGQAPLTLRLYRWRPACLSLGYFQRLREIKLAACQAAGVDVVRRPTGGRAILHADELTYSLAAPATHPRLSGRVLDSYRVISAALLAGLQQLGVAAEWAATAAAGATSAACFDTPADYEITVAGRKLVGSAQTRTSGAILQHGTLLLSADVDQLYALLDLPGLSAADLAARMIALDEASGRSISFEQAAEGLIAGFTQAWGASFARSAPTAAEWQLAEQLRADRYANPAWTERR